MLNKLIINQSKNNLIVYISLTAILFAVFWQVNKFDFINLDDTVYVTENLYIQSGIALNGILWAFSATYAEFWHPLTWLSLMFDYQLYGLNAGGYHLTNVILHIMSALLLFWLFKRMTQEIWKSAFIAAFFALHPLRVESIAWVAERKDVLSAFFWMLTLCLYVYYTEKPAFRRYLLVLFSFILALMSKPIVITLPVVMILLDYWPLGRFQLQRGSLILWQLREKIPFFIFSVIISIITLYAQPKTQIRGWPYVLESRIINALVVIVAYLEKIFWPDNLTVLYPFFSQVPIWQILGIVLLILVISVAVILSIRRLPFIFVGWFWFLITLLPVLGIIPVGTNSMADRYIYLPSIGIAIMLTWGVFYLIKSENIRKKILFPAAITFLIILSVLTWKQCGYWKNSFTLFGHALHIDEHNYQAHINLASYLVKEGNFKEAIDYYNKAILIKPDKADAYNNRGIVFSKMEQYEHAVDDYNEAIRMQTNNAHIYHNRAFAYFNQGNNIAGCNDALRACQLGNCKTLYFAKKEGLCR
jgi:hypothetical protein